MPEFTTVSTIPNFKPAKLSRPAHEVMVDAVNRVNGSGFHYTDVTFGAPSANSSGQGNTAVVLNVLSTPRSQPGTVDLTYDRYELAAVMTEPNYEIDQHTDWTRIKHLLPAINARFQLNLTPADIVDGALPTDAFPRTVTIAASTSSLLYQGSQDVVLAAGLQPSDTQVVLSAAPAVAQSVPAGTVYNHTYTATGGTGTIGFELYNAPPGWSIDPSTGELSTAPIEGDTGNLIFAVTARDANGNFASREDKLKFTVTYPAPTLTGGAPDGAVNNTFAYTAAGGTAPYVFTISNGVAPGTLDPASGILTYENAGTFTFEVTVTDAHDQTDTVSESVTVA